MCFTMQFHYLKLANNVEEKYSHLHVCRIAILNTRDCDGALWILDATSIPPLHTERLRVCREVEFYFIIATRSDLVECCNWLLNRLDWKE